MIRLTEIICDGDIVSALVTTVEAEPRVFRVSYNIKTNEIVENTYGKMCMSVGMAIGKLIKLAEENGHKLPEVAESVWY